MCLNIEHALKGQRGGSATSDVKIAVVHWRLATYFFSSFFSSFGGGGGGGILKFCRLSAES